MSRPRRHHGIEARRQATSGARTSGSGASANFLERTGLGEGPADPGNRVNTCYLLNTKSIGKDRVHVISRAGLIVLVVLSTGGGAWADQDLIKPGEETFRVKLGGIINESNTSLRLDGSSGRSREVNLEDAGLEKDSAGFLGEATWRFAANHRIGIQTFAIQRSGSKTTAQDIQLGDNVVPAGTTLSAESKSRFLIADYEYSFVKNDRLELAGLVGLYGARFKFNFNATSPVTNVDRSTDAPLPVLGASLDFFVNPRWSVALFGEGMKIKIGDVDGRVYYAGISTDYMLTRHFGLGIGYSLADLKVDVAKGDFSGRIGWRMNSLFGYGQARF